MSKQWVASEAEKVNAGKYMGTLEIDGKKGEIHAFELIELSDRILFGGACNTGFLESGYIMKEEGEHVQRTLEELIDDLQVFYMDGKEYVSRIVHNERM